MKANKEACRGQIMNTEHFKWFITIYIPRRQSCPPATHPPTSLFLTYLRHLTVHHANHDVSVLRLAASSSFNPCQPASYGCCSVNFSALLEKVAQRRFSSLWMFKAGGGEKSLIIKSKTKFHCNSGLYSAIKRLWSNKRTADC